MLLLCLFVAPFNNWSAAAASELIVSCFESVWLLLPNAYDCFVNTNNLSLIAVRSACYVYTNIPFLIFVDYVCIVMSTLDCVMS
jgi:hypothetical protein